MAIQNLSTLKPGDILIVDYGSQNGHTMIVVKQLNNSGSRDSIEVAHCPGPGQNTQIQSLSAVCPVNDVSADKLFAWRRTNNRLFTSTYSKGRLVDIQKLAATLAQYWSTQKTSGYGNSPGRLILNASRQRGVAKQYDHGKGNPPMMNYDALFRIFKYANRYQNKNAFVNARGTTCCSFVVACHQTAAMLVALEKEPKSVYAGYKKLLDGRKSKAKTKQKKPGSSLMSNANVGTKNKKWLFMSIKEIWKEIAPELKSSWSKKKYPTLDVILTKPLMVDAKFLYTLALKERLNLPASRWVKC